MESKNFSYAFNEEYFKEYVAIGSSGTPKEQASARKALNESIRNKDFNFTQVTPVEELVWQQVGQLKRKDLVLYSTYPGVLIGIGYVHDIHEKGAIATGFSLDYVTGMPYLPGSSLKGLLRSVFPSQAQDDIIAEEMMEYVQDVAKEKSLSYEDIKDLESEIFDNGDVFIGAYPDLKDDDNKSLVDLDYITPHKTKLIDPQPVPMVRVCPGVAFRFSFLLRDSEVSGKSYTADKKLDMFRQILLDMGIGAKTNVGYGKMSESRPRVEYLSGANQDKAKGEIPEKKTKSVHDNIIAKALKERTETVSVEKVNLGDSGINSFVIAKCGQSLFRCNDVPIDVLYQLQYQLDTQKAKNKLKIQIKYEIDSEKHDEMVNAHFKSVATK